MPDYCQCLQWQVILNMCRRNYTSSPLVLPILHSLALALLMILLNKTILPQEGQFPVVTTDGCNDDEGCTAVRNCSAIVPEFRVPRNSTLDVARHVKQR